MLWLILGGIFVVAVLEAVFRLLPVSMGLYRTEQFEKWPLQNFESHLPYTYSSTWAMLNVHRGVTNNYGHPAPFDYKKQSRPLLVIGDSYIESLMNDFSDTLQAQLGVLLNSPSSVYGLGVSGLSISDYLALSRLAHDEFRPAAAVFMITDGDFSESLGRRIGNYFFATKGDELALQYAPLYGDTLMKRIRQSIGEISFYRYLEAHLGFSLDAVLSVFRNIASFKLAGGRAVQNVDLQRKVADKFLAELPESLGIPKRCIVFLMDSDRYAIYNVRSASTPKDWPEVRQYFIEQAQEKGFMVSDLDPVFRDRYMRDRVKFDYWPFDRHWNDVGHGVAANEAYRLLSAKEQQHCLPARSGK